MAKQTFNYYRELPGWAKGLILIMFILVILYVVYVGVKGIKKLIDIAKSRELLSDSDTQIKALQQNGQQQNFSNAQYTAWAEAIAQAMNGYGTDEQAIENIIMQLHNDVDCYKLIQAFGTRTVTGGWGIGDFTGNLAQCFASELDSGEIQDMNRNLRTRGITFQF